MDYPRLYPTREQIDYVLRLLDCKHASEPWRGDYDGDYGRRFNGLLAQTLIADFFKRPRPMIDTADNGYDIELGGKIWDVKAHALRGKPRPECPVTLAVVASQAELHGNDYYLFLVRDKCAPALTYYVIGYTSREEVLKWRHMNRGEELEFKGKGYPLHADKYIGDASQVTPVRDLSEL